MSCQLRQNFLDEVPEFRRRVESRRLSRREMLDTSTAAGLGASSTLLQLEHEGVVGAQGSDRLTQGEAPIECRIVTFRVERPCHEPSVQGKARERSIPGGER
jgi:hypothetical protein